MIQARAGLARVAIALKTPVLLSSSNAQWQNGDTLPEPKELVANQLESVRSTAPTELSTLPHGADFDARRTNGRRAAVR